MAKDSRGVVIEGLGRQRLHSVGEISGRLDHIDGDIHRSDSLPLGTPATHLSSMRADLQTASAVI